VDIEGDALTVEVKETKAWIYLMSTRLLKGHVIVARREFCDVESVMGIWTDSSHVTGKSTKTSELLLGIIAILALLYLRYTLFVAIMQSSRLLMTSR
jgi:hypothetical protein